MEPTQISRLVASVRHRLRTALPPSLQDATASHSAELESLDVVAITSDGGAYNETYSVRKYAFVELM